MDLLGNWELVEWAKVGRQGVITHPFTAAARGRILYTADGLMGGFLMHPRWMVPEPQPRRDHFISYSGRYAVDVDIVSHSVDLASEPQSIGTVLRRAVALSPEGLVLTTLSSDDLAGSSWLHHRLRFRRAETSTG
jgi:hypothetical protein